MDYRMKMLNLLSVKNSSNILRVSCKYSNRSIYKREQNDFKDTDEAIDEKMIINSPSIGLSGL